MNVLDQILQEQKEQRTLLSSMFDYIQKPIPEDKYYSVDEYSEKIGVHPQSTRNAIKDGRVKANRFGRRVLIHSSQIEQGLKEFKSLRYRRD
ncbi:hypothetical protein M0D21_10170 [Aquimarina sp. D1M17]|uniref:hypothetical protein n=1 Tax=Aquimarina acroporae TaxID=2937283 RepID=UPI0020BE8FFB|nr:hypothetical protein [Aquimarina acroporae]MCK8521934.1 hypothetical protein [Aquimarina acroporae]